MEDVNSSTNTGIQHSSYAVDWYGNPVSTTLQDKCRRTLLAIANTMTSIVSTVHTYTFLRWKECVLTSVVDGDLFLCSQKEADTCM